MSSNLKVSILISNYNYAEYLDECINSCLNQTYDNFEVILFDDNSTDNSLQIASKYEDKITILKNSNKSKALFTSYNQANAIYKAFLASDGEIICLIDSDDTFAPNKLTKVVELFETNNIIVVENSGHRIDKLGNYLESIKAHESSDFIGLYKKYQHTNFHMATSFLSFQRQYLIEVFPRLLRQEFPFVYPDNKLTSIAPYFGKVVSISDSLTHYRWHGQNETILNNNELLRIIQHQNYVNIFLSSIGEKKLNIYKFKYYWITILKTYVPKSTKGSVKLKNFIKNYLKLIFRTR
jgi:glycosyltransferase involved in cell wall biosynthesis